MSTKCEFDGKKYTPCEAVEKTIQGMNGHYHGFTLLALADMSNGDEYYGGLIYRYGKKKNDMRLCNYCPACGVNIAKGIERIEKPEAMA